MDPRGSTHLDWGDGTYLFRLTVPGMVELEGVCDAPMAVIFRRVHAGEYSVSDIRETLRLGLIGGGLDPTAPLQKIRTQFEDNIAEVGLAYHHPYARAVLGGAMMGFIENPLAPATPEVPGVPETPSESMSSPSTPKFADLDSNPAT